MSFILGLDVGTSAGAAATKQDGRVQPSELGENGSTVPSTVVLHDDGTFLTGEDAQRVAGLELVRVARDLRRDPMLQADPIVVGGQVSTPYNMLRALYTGLVERVCQQHGEVPTHVVVTHPALPDGLRCDIVERIADELFPGAMLVPEPVAATVKLACDCLLPTEGNILVYDLGGGTLDLALVRRDGDHFSIVGEPSGMSQFGGIDIDDMVLGHVDASLTGAIANLDLADPVALTTLDRLRSECRRAKEQLSTETEVSIDASLPENPALVTMRRHELEELLFPRVEASMDAVERMVADAGLRVSDIDAIALVGGSARIPLIPELLRARTQLPVVIDDAPELTAAVGAAQMVDDDASAASVFPIAGTSSALEPAGVGGRHHPGVGPAAAAAARLAGQSGETHAAPPRSGAYSQPESIRAVRAADPTRVGETEAERGSAAPPASESKPEGGPEAEVGFDGDHTDMFGKKANPRIRNALVGGSAALLLAAVVLVGLRNTSSTVRADEGGSSSGRESSQADQRDGDRGRLAADDEDDDEDASGTDSSDDDDTAADGDGTDGSTTTDSRADEVDGDGDRSNNGSTSSSSNPPQSGGSTSSSAPTPRPTTSTTRPTTTTTRPTTTTSTPTTTTTSTPTTTTTSTPTTTVPPGDD